MFHAELFTTSSINSDTRINYVICDLICFHYIFDKKCTIFKELYHFLISTSHFPLFLPFFSPFAIFTTSPQTDYQYINIIPIFYTSNRSSGAKTTHQRPPPFGTPISSGCIVVLPQTSLSEQPLINHQRDIP